MKNYVVVVEEHKKKNVQVNSDINTNRSLIFFFYWVLKRIRFAV